jgi:predicted nucleic acid-binding Zn ribbon protein
MRDIDDAVNSPEETNNEQRRRRRFGRISFGITAVILLTAVAIFVGAALVIAF